MLLKSITPSTHGDDGRYQTAGGTFDTDGIAYLHGHAVESLRREPQCILVQKSTPRVCGETAPVAQTRISLAPAGPWTVPPDVQRPEEASFPFDWPGVNPRDLGAVSLVARKVAVDGVPHRVLADAHSWSRMIGPSASGLPLHKRLSRLS